VTVCWDVCFEKEYTSYVEKAIKPVFLGHKSINDKEVRRTKKLIMTNSN